ncbi:ABC-three component system middle component 5 [Limimaricola pyoseonensis]|nr:ABC-three component system middle component 5 [Limimaricola pyoseonensis]
MLNISYSAAYDPYHTAFRFLMLLRASSEGPKPYDWLRISDFYLCFPKRLSDFSAPRKVTGLQGRIRRLVKSLPDVHYASLPESRDLFERMKVIQDTALSALSKKNLVSYDMSGGQRMVRLGIEEIPEPLLSAVNGAITKNQALLEILAQDFVQIETLGIGGLKDRSDLEEYQYDTV